MYVYLHHAYKFAIIQLNDLPILLHMIRISTFEVSSDVLTPKWLEIGPNSN